MSAIKQVRETMSQSKPTILLIEDDIEDIWIIQQALKGFKKAHQLKTERNEAQFLASIDESVRFHLGSAPGRELFYKWACSFYPS